MAWAPMDIWRTFPHCKFHGSNHFHCQQTLVHNTIWKATKLLLIPAPTLIPPKKNQNWTHLWTSQLHLLSMLKQRWLRHVHYKIILMTGGPWSHTRKTDPCIHTSWEQHCLIPRADGYTLKWNTYTSTMHKRACFFHMKYHPEDPSWRLIQQLWQEYITIPPNEIHFSQLTNNEDIPVCVDQLIVAYSCHLNLWNLFSVRNIDNRGKKVSHYLPHLSKWSL